MNKITEIVGEYLKDCQFNHMNHSFFPEEEDFVKKYKDLIEDSNLPCLIAELYECEIDWQEVRNIWWDYNKYAN